MRIFWLVLLLALSACSSPQPTQPTVTILPSAVVVVEPGFTLGGATCSLSAASARGCTFQGLVRNSGVGCASNVRGVTSVFNGQGITTDTLSWTIAATMRPNEVAAYEVCCVSRASQGFSVGPITWDNVRCP